MAPKALLFGSDKSPIRNAAEMGLRRLGYDIELQIPACWSPADAISTADAVVVVGLRSRAGEAAQYYARKGIPVAMIDLAHLRERPGQTRQLRVTAPRHDWLPPVVGGEVPLDRLEALDIQVDKRTRVKGQHVLVCGQVAGDSAHGMSRSEIITWAKDVRDRIRALTDSAIVWRPHPGEPYEIDGFDGYSDSRTESLQEAFSKTWLVATWNSTSGLEALVAGLPVIAEGESIYSDLTWAVQDFGKIRARTEGEVQDLLAHIAYTQWTPEEIQQDGWPLRLAFGEVSVQGVAKASRKTRPEPQPEPPELEPKITEDADEPQSEAAEAAPTTSADDAEEVPEPELKVEPEPEPEPKPEPAAKPKARTRRSSRKRK